MPLAVIFVLLLTGALGSGFTAACRLRTGMILGGLSLLGQVTVLLLGWMFFFGAEPRAVLPTLFIALPLILAWAHLIRRRIRAADPPLESAEGFGKHRRKRRP